MVEFKKTVSIISKPLKLISRLYISIIYLVVLPKITVLNIHYFQCSIIFVLILLTLAGYLGDIWLMLLF